MLVPYISLQWTCAENKRWYLLQRLPFHQNVIATREMFCCDLAFEFQLHTARNLAPVQNIPSTLQATEGWGRLFFMALFCSRSMPAPRPAMINAGYTNTTPGAPSSGIHHGKWWTLRDVIGEVGCAYKPGLRNQ